jgi:hypothetical protein
LYVGLLVPAPAGALVAKVEASPGVATTFGLQPREVSRYWEGTRKWKGLGTLATEENFGATTFDNDPAFPNRPGPVMHSAATYAIYWDPENNYYHGDWQGLINGFLANLGYAGGQANNVFAVDTQYTDETNLPAASRSVFHGAYTDTNPYPAAGCTDPAPLEYGGPLTCLTDAQIRAQLELFISQHGLQKGMGTIFYLLTPPGVTVCLDGGGSTGHCSDHTGTIAEENGSYKNSFCSYHSDITTNPEYGNSDTILYAMIPWTAGGEGDNHLSKADNTPAYDCQDGGFEPGTKPNGELQEKEQVKTPTPKEEEEFEKKTQQEKREQREAEALGLQAPHDQEPNQLGAVRGPDGSYDTGLADLIINQVAVEQQNTITDPLLDGWQDEAGSEVTDECRNSFFSTVEGGSPSASPLTKAGTLFNQKLNGADYYLNDAFNLAALTLTYPGIPCLGGIALEPKFTSPDPVKSGETVGFDGMESNISLDGAIGYTSFGTHKPNYATYMWNFGDGSPTVTGFAPGAPSANSPNASPCEAPWLSPCAASTYHSYQYGGTYEVTLTVTDVGGNTASVTKPVTVEGPPPPSSPGSGSGSGSSSSGAASSSTVPATSSPAASPSATGATGTPAKPPVPNPVAAAAVVSKSLASVLRGGLIVRYSVNEQVAGRFEVLLAASIAKRIGLHGTSAAGLPQGTAPQVVIAKAILVTTKGGRSSIKILFSKATAARLRKLHKVSLMLRLFVRNASSQSPTTTTVLSTVNLGR